MINVTDVKVDLEFKREYPYLGEIAYPQGSKKIVLFVGKNKGTVVFVSSGIGGSSLGEYSEDWSEHMFTPYKGKLELTNQF